MENFVIVGWPDIQEIMCDPDFDEYATMINPNYSMGIEDDTYLVDRKWYNEIIKIYHI